MMNLYHASFKELIALADKSNPDAIEDPGARELWKQTLIQSVKRPFFQTPLSKQIA